ncbi:ATP-binding protein [Trueperella bialowiezensis]|uniref:ATP-binding protein n=1 Tax=Trueperella bialowiezensis TaxID=312285 RepID=A0A448PEB9_9ACTO|nr:ATP-binding protein [Trueperella bialowiezensis]VEI13291.1 Uncharacterised protein [Trueperella bialowiezensis]
MSKHYIPRIVDAELRRAAETAGAVVVRGARACGKTESARQIAASELRLDSQDPVAMLARTQPEVALAGKTPRLLDEWQVAPGLWNAVRHAVDDRREPGQFILAGSASPDDDPSRHSGAGRFRRVRMRTMTLSESGHSTGAVSLASLLQGDIPPLESSDISFPDLVSRIVSGGWPGWITADEQPAQAMAHSYIEDIAEHDFPAVAGARRDPRRILAYLTAVAALTAQPVTNAAIVRRMREEAIGPVGEAAVPQLHDFAERMFLVEEQHAWAPKLRSRQPLVQMPKRHLADPSLAAALLNATSDRLMGELETLGFLFESQVVHDLRVYAQANSARGVFHLRDAKGRDEIDVIVEGESGQWLAIEVKLAMSDPNSDVIEAAAQNLRRVCAKIERPPVAMIVMTSTGITYRRDDGVLVVPLTVLGP